MAKPKQDKSIAEQLQEQFNNLTRAERQLAHSILENYPLSGLDSVSNMAENASVSMPTVVRMSQKLGFNGVQEFRSALREELKAQISSPAEKSGIWVPSAPPDHILNQYMEAQISNIGMSLDQIEVETFDEISRLLANTSHKILCAGGRITRVLADYLYLHLQVIREHVILVQPSFNAWPHALLDIEKDDVVVIFDVRRYENSLLKFAEMAREAGAQIVLFTDQWQSPISKYSDHCIRGHIAVPTTWVSTAALLMLVEALIAATQEVNSKQSQDRITKLEGMFDRTRFFRKFK